MRSLFILLLMGFLLPLNGQTNAKLQQVLNKELSVNSQKDGRWVYYPDKANITTVEKPLLGRFLPNYTIYKLTLTNYLGYHVNEVTCVVLFDSLRSEIVLVEPLWYGDVSESLIKLVLKKPFDTKEQLMAVLKELHEVMEIGSGYAFINTGSTDHLITYDLVYKKGDSYTTGGNGTSSTVNYTQDGIWRQIKVKVKDLKIIEYTSIN